MPNQVEESKAITGWKRLAVICTFTGAGIAIMLALIFGAALWYESRPKPWNNKAIEAKFDSCGEDFNGDPNYIAFDVQNHTQSDYHLDSETVRYAAQNDEGVLDFHRPDSLQIPSVLIPPQQRVSVTFKVAGEFEHRHKGTTEDPIPATDATLWGLNLPKGPQQLVLFDSVNRYEIVFPVPRNLKCQ